MNSNTENTELPTSADAVDEEVVDENYDEDEELSTVEEIVHLLNNAEIINPIFDAYVKMYEAVPEFEFSEDGWDRYINFVGANLLDVCGIDSDEEDVRYVGAAFAAYVAASDKTK